MNYLSVPRAIWWITIGSCVCCMSILPVLSLQGADKKFTSWPSFRKDAHNSGRANWTMPTSAKDWNYETLPPPGGDSKIFASPALVSNELDCAQIARNLPFLVLALPG